jgi:hypothetical protein
MRTIVKFFSAMFAVAVLATLAIAADKPNFSGEWALDLDKSNFGPMGGPASMTRKIDHTDPDLNVTQTSTGGPQGDQTVSLKYSTDGKETTNQLMGTPAKTTASWDGGALVIKMSIDAGGTEILLTQRVTLSDDGKVMTDASHIVTPQGEFDMTQVFNKK